MLSTTDNFRSKDPQRMKVKGWKKTFRENRNKKIAWVAILIPDKIDFKTKAIITRDGKGPSNSTFGDLFEESQNTRLKRHIQPYVHCSIIYNSQYMEAVCVSFNR